MKPAPSKPFTVHSISEQHAFLSLPAPEHPLVRVINLIEQKRNAHRLN